MKKKIQGKKKMKKKKKKKKKIINIILISFMFGLLFDWGRV